MNRALYYSLWALAITVLYSIQTAFILSVPSIAALVSLPLVASLFFAIVRKTTTALFFAGITGYIADLSSALPFGLFIFANLLAVLSLLLMQKNVLKNFAIHAVFINSLVALCVYHMVWSLSALILRQLEFIDISAFTFIGYWSQAMLHIAIQIVILLCLFFGANAMLKYLGRTTLHI